MVGDAKLSGKAYHSVRYQHLTRENGSAVGLCPSCVPGLPAVGFVRPLMIKPFLLLLSSLWSRFRTYLIFHLSSFLFFRFQLVFIVVRSFVRSFLTIPSAPLLRLSLFASGFWLLASLPCTALLSSYCFPIVWRRRGLFTMMRILRGVYLSLCSTFILVV